MQDSRKLKKARKLKYFKQRTQERKITQERKRIQELREIKKERNVKNARRLRKMSELLNAKEHKKVMYTVEFKCSASVSQLVVYSIRAAPARLFITGIARISNNVTSGCPQEKVNAAVLLHASVSAKSRC